jgi:formylglycine-generating enzyme required for sulfatase activity
MRLRLATRFGWVVMLTAACSKILGMEAGELAKNESDANVGGAAGAAGGVAGTGGAAGAAGSGGPTCPQIAGTTLMVSVPTSSGSGFCIDRTEVTVAQYLAFIDADAASAATPGCEANTTHVPDCQQTLAKDTNKPVVCIDWCDAFDYCKSVGKRLCGKIGGGTLTTEETTDASKDEWFAACSKGGSLTYPYGSTYDPNACNGSEDPSPGLQDVGSFASCEGGYPDLFDMSGNAIEWEDAHDGSGDAFKVRGGADDGVSDTLKCTLSVYQGRMTTSAHRGFRCCH